MSVPKRLSAPPEPKNSERADSNLMFQHLPLEIREHIFKLLPSKDLRTCCRLVNVQWRAEANSVLKSKSRKEPVSFALVKIPCRDLIQLESDLKEFNFEIIRGLKLNGLCCITKPGNCLSDDEEDDAASTLTLPDGDGTFSVGFVPWKAISIQGVWRRHCPAWNKVKQILRMAKESLEELRVEYPPWSGDLLHEFLCESTQTQSLASSYFPKLHTIGGSTWTANSFRLLLHMAPNLRGIDCPSAFSWRDFGVDYGTVALKITSAAYFYKPQNLELLRKFVQAEPSALKVLRLRDICGHQNLHKDLIARLFHLNRSSLETLDLCAVQIVAAAWLNGSVTGLPGSFMYFPKLTKLSLPIPRAVAYVPLLRRLNLGQSFPALKEVEIMEGGCDCDDPLPHPEDEEENKEWTVFEAHSFVPSHASSLVSSSLSSQQHLEVPKMRLLGHAFPYVTEMQIRWSLDGDLFALSHMFLSFSRLEILSLTIVAEAQSPAILDAVLCGLSPEEVERILYDDDYLRNTFKSLPSLLCDLSIVPVRPSLTYLKHLKELTIMTLVDSRIESGISGFSEVLAISRLPKLERYFGPHFQGCRRKNISCLTNGSSSAWRRRRPMLSTRRNY